MPALLMVHEDKPTYIDHDQLFKQLISTFFEEFIALFFPEMHQQLDFSSIKPLADEVFTDLIHGERRQADMVMEVSLKGQDTLLIIHVESQSYTQEKFRERMYQYFSLLYTKYRKPILPIALFTYDTIRDEPDIFEIKFPFHHVLTFRFLKVELKKQNWRTFLTSDNPIAAALLSKMGYKQTERIQVKKEFLRMLARMELNPAKMKLVFGFFESYMKLNKMEEETLMESLRESKDESLEEFVEKLPNSWRDKGLREGREVGIKEGRKEGRKEGIKVGKEEGRKEGREVGKIEGKMEGKTEVLADVAIRLITKFVAPIPENMKELVQQQEISTLESIIDNIDGFKNIEEIKKYLK